MGILFPDALYPCLIRGFSINSSARYKALYIHHSNDTNAQPLAFDPARVESQLKRGRKECQFTRSPVLQLGQRYEIQSERKG